MKRSTLTFTLWMALSLAPTALALDTSPSAPVVPATTTNVTVEAKSEVVEAKADGTLRTGSSPGDAEATVNVSIGAADARVEVTNEENSSGPSPTPSSEVTADGSVDAKVEVTNETAPGTSGATPKVETATRITPDHGDPQPGAVQPRVDIGSQPPLTERTAPAVTTTRARSGDTVRRESAKAGAAARNPGSDPHATMPGFVVGPLVAGKPSFFRDAFSRLGEPGPESVLTIPSTAQTAPAPPTRVAPATASTAAEQLTGAGVGISARGPIIPALRNPFDELIESMAANSQKFPAPAAALAPGGSEAGTGGDEESILAQAARGTVDLLYWGVASWWLPIALLALVVGLASRRRATINS